MMQNHSEFLTYRLLLMAKVTEIGCRFGQNMAKIKMYENWGNSSSRRRNLKGMSTIFQHNVY